MYENYTIRQFINAMYKNDRSVMSDEEFHNVYTEYIDTTGLYDSDDFNKSAYIYYLNNRINSIKLAIRLQKEFLQNFGVPYLQELKFFNRFGHFLTWKDEQNFLSQLTNIETKEKKYISQLEANIKQLTEKRHKKKPEEKTIEQSRGKFIRMLNSLGKANYRIDNDKTTVEELAYMIKQITEDSKNI